METDGSVERVDPDRRAVEAHYRDLFDAWPVGVSTTRMPDGAILTYANPAMPRRTARSGSTTSSATPLTECIHPRPREGPATSPHRRGSRADRRRPLPRATQGRQLRGRRHLRHPDRVRLRVGRVLVPSRRERDRAGRSRPARGRVARAGDRGVHAPGPARIPPRGRRPSHPDRREPGGGPAHRPRSQRPHRPADRASVPRTRGQRSTWSVQARRAHRRDLGDREAALPRRRRPRCVVRHPRVQERTGRGHSRLRRHHRAETYGGRACQGPRSPREGGRGADRRVDRVQSRAAGGHRGEERVPRQHEPRTAHAAQLDHRLQRHPPPGHRGTAHPGAAAAGHDDPPLGPAAPRARRRRARPREDRGGPDRADDRRVRRASLRGRARGHDPAAGVREGPRTERGHQRCARPHGRRPREARADPAEPALQCHPLHRDGIGEPDGDGTSRQLSRLLRQGHRDRHPGRRARPGLRGVPPAAHARGWPRTPAPVSAYRSRDIWPR